MIIFELVYILKCFIFDFTIKVSHFRVYDIQKNTSIKFIVVCLIDKDTVFQFIIRVNKILNLCLRSKCVIFKKETINLRICIKYLTISDNDHV